MKRNVFEYDSDSEPENIKKKKENEKNGKQRNCFLPFDKTDREDSDDSEHTTDHEISLGSTHQLAQYRDDDYKTMEFGPKGEIPHTAKASLDTPISLSVGMAMMQKMGFRPGDTLGRNEAGNLAEPISILVKRDRKGVGATTRVARAAGSTSVKQYRQAAKQRHTETERRKLLLKLQRFCFQKSGDDEKVAVSPGSVESVDVLWREYARNAMARPQGRTLLFEEKDRADVTGEKYFLESGEEPGVSSEKCDNQSLDSEGRMKTAGKGEEFLEKRSESTKRSDSKKDPEFELEDHLAQILAYCREHYLYCPFCSIAYGDEADMQENCPGLNEEDHEGI